MTLRLEQGIETAAAAWQTSLENAIDAGMLSDDQKDFLREKMAEIYNENDFSQELKGRKELADRIIKDFRSNGASSILSALIDYIEKYESERASNELYSLLDVTRDAYEGLNEECQRLNFKDEVIMMYAATLGQKSVARLNDRSIVCMLLRRLDGYDFTRLSDPEKEKVIDALNAAIDNFNLRSDMDDLTLEDMEHCLALQRRIFPGRNFVLPQETLSLLKRAAPNLPEKIVPPDPNTIHRLVESAKNRLNQLGDVPEKAVPALQLHYFNNLRLKNNGEETGSELEEKRKLTNFIVAERFAERNPYLPTVGVEIEVPHKFKVDEPLFQATVDLGIPHSYNLAWEFSVDYTYSSEMQCLLVKELIRGGFIETEEFGGQKNIAGMGDFSLHVNIGIPLNLIDDFAQNERHQESFKKRADALVNAFSYAFSSPERIVNRKTSTRFRANEVAKISKKNLNNDGQSSSDFKRRETSDELWYGRLEIRSLELRDATFYRLMPEAQLLASALFAACSPESTLAIKKSLMDIWTSFEADVLAILDRYNLTLESIDMDYQRAEIAALLTDTTLQKEFRELISRSAMQIKRLIKPT